MSWSSEEGLAALLTIVSTQDVEIERADFYDLILPFLTTSNSITREQAFRALFVTGPKEGDLQMVKDLQLTSSMHGCIASLLSLYTNHDLSGESGDIIAGLLDKTEDPILGRSLLQGMSSPRFSPALESALLAATHSEEEELSHYAIYSGLSKMNPKSEAVVRRMLEMLAEPDKKSSYPRIIWALGQSNTIPDELRTAVSKAVLKSQSLDDAYYAPSGQY